MNVESIRINGNSIKKQKQTYKCIVSLNKDRIRAIK